MPQHVGLLLDVKHSLPDAPGEDELDLFVDACVAAIDRFDVAVVAWSAEPDDVPALLGRGVTALCGDDVPGLVRARDSRRTLRQSA